ncbi:MAG: ribosome recycling factor [Clostridiales bacterium]|nr:ribosome recycling factor [Clostridiales bacterium]
MYQPVIDQASDKMEKTKDAYRRELVSLRAGRANPKLLDRIVVDYYGTQTPLNQMANIMSPEPRLLTISLWDPKAIPLVEKAILKSDLGLNPANDGKLIRLVIPELNEERRKELTRLVWRSAEESKVAIRNIRRDAMETIKKMQKNSEITEDDQRVAEAELQKVTDAAVKDIDEQGKEKEKEIMAV